MSRGTVLFVGNFLSESRKHRHYCEDLANRLEARDWAVLRTSAQPGRLRKLADMVRVTWSERHHYELAHVDVFSGPAFAWAEVVCFELRRLGKPFVLTLHGGGLPIFATKWPRRTRRLLASAAAVTCPSPYLRAEMASHAHDITIIPNGIELARYPFAVRSPARPRLIWLRAFHRLYNPVLAIDVLAAVRAKVPDATLQMIGPDRGDGALDQVQRRIHELGVADSVEIVGPVANLDVPRHLADGDIFLNTTDSDNTPVSLLEALACGLCVVTTNVGGIPYLVEHDREGLLVPPRDRDAMAAAVLRLLADPALARKMSEAGRARAESCDWSRVLDRWDSVLRSAARA